MAIELKIDGYFKMVIFSHGTRQPIDREDEQGVLDSLQQGEYLMDIESKTIEDINDLDTPLYSFDIAPQDNVDYDFNELE